MRQSFPKNLVFHLQLLLIVVVAFPASAFPNRIQQRTFVPNKAINFVDATKHGFRVVLHDTFLKTALAPSMLPTLYVSAIPMRPDETAQYRTFYPDTLYEEKQINVAELRESAWYALCVEWEAVGRHNETTGVDCRLFRTLDRTGKGAESSIVDLAIPDASTQSVAFRMRAAVDFPLRVTVSLEGGTGPVPPAQAFLLTESADLEGVFPFLRPDTNYGQLCVLEEPLPVGYTAMGRLVAGLHVHKCYFGGIATKSDIQSSVAIDQNESGGGAESSAYRRSLASSSPASQIPLLLILALLLSALSSSSSPRIN